MSFAGSYYIGEDVGTGPDDILTMRRHTSWTARPHDGTAPDLPQPTATGVLEAIRASARHAFGSPSLADQRVAIVGLGHVGGPLAQMLAREVSGLLVSDADAGRWRRRSSSARRPWSRSARSRPGWMCWYRPRSAE